VSFFRALLPECEKHSVGLALENIFDSAATEDGRNSPRWYGSVPDEQCELIDALKHPLVGACWDTGHARIMKLDQRAALTTLGSRLKAVHIQENDGANDDHMLPFHNGTAGVDWTAVTDGLRAAKYKGAFTYEVHNAFRALPLDLWDPLLRYSVAVARHLVARIEA
jgi:sugar phosphate isomerase/epimerase